MASPCCTRRLWTTGSRLGSKFMATSPATECLYRNTVIRRATKRFMATETVLPSKIENDPPSLTNPIVKVVKISTPSTKAKFSPISQVLTTAHQFPSMEPTAFLPYPSDFLHAPLRKDILQRAIIYEGNAHRLGRAKTKWRDEIHGGHKKIRPQKGTGRARLGTRQSPMLVGGGKAHGPKPRDFRSKLPRKMYDLAFRTALSYRYRRGELLVVDNSLEVEWAKTRHVRHIMTKHKWGKEHRRTLFITLDERKKLWAGIKAIPHHGTALTVKEIDVKDLLEMGRLVFEKEALNWLLEQHGPLIKSL